MLGLLTLFVGVAFAKEADNETVGIPLIIGGAGVMVAAYASGGIGYFRVKRCRKAIKEFEQSSALPGPGAQPYPAVGPQP